MAFFKIYKADLLAPCSIRRFGLGADVRCVAALGVEQNCLNRCIRTEATAAKIAPPRAVAVVIADGLRILGVRRAGEMR